MGWRSWTSGCLRREDLAIYDGRLLLEWIRDDPETGDQVVKLASASYDAATATVDADAAVRCVGPPRAAALQRTTRSDRLRLLGVHELIRMASDAGLGRRVSWRGTIGWGPLVPGRSGSSW